MEGREDRIGWIGLEVGRKAHSTTSRGWMQGLNTGLGRRLWVTVSRQWGGVEEYSGITHVHPSCTARGFFGDDRDMGLLIGWMPVQSGNV